NRSGVLHWGNGRKWTQGSHAGLRLPAAQTETVAPISLVAVSCFDGLRWKASVGLGTLSMRRRDFIAGVAAATWPLAARAQQPGKLPTIGYLGGGSAISQRAWAAAFVQRLREHGWVEGRTVAIEYRWGEGRPERYAEVAAELVRLKVDVILAGGTEAAIAAKQVTSTIPIVFPTAGDPIGSKLVASLARPGGNVTGLSNLG